MIHTFVWGVGVLVCTIGAVLAVTFIIAGTLDYCWRKWGDLDTFLQVMKEASAQGRNVFKRKSECAIDMKAKSDG